MTDAASLPLLVLLPGLDGTGQLFAGFVRVLGTGVETQVLSYPKEKPLGYQELEALARASLPTDRAFVVLGESFSGPIAIRIAADPPSGLVGVILCGTFVRNPYPLLGWAGPLASWFPVKSLPRWARAPIMWGSMSPDRAPDQVARAASQEMVEIALRAQLIEIEGPHLLLQRRPAECAAVVVEFVRAVL